MTLRQFVLLAAALAALSFTAADARAQMGEQAPMAAQPAPAPAPAKKPAKAKAMAKPAPAPAPAEESVAEETAPAAAPAARNFDLGRLSEDERKAYNKGEITTGKMIAGGLMGSLLGFGTGHIFYHRYWDIGWVFTVGEAAGWTLIATSIDSWSKCYGTDDDDGLTESGCAKSGKKGTLALGYAVLLGFHIWEVIDVWTYPSRQNRAYRAAKAKAEGRVAGAFAPRISPFVSFESATPAYGLALGFDF